MDCGGRGGCCALCGVCVVFGARFSVSRAQRGARRGARRADGARRGGASRREATSLGTSLSVSLDPRRPLAAPQLAARLAAWLFPRYLSKSQTLPSRLQTALAASAALRPALYAGANDGSASLSRSAAKPDGSGAKIWLTKPVKRVA